jgi:tetratricopeptide (TPR) repeat protein
VRRSHGWRLAAAGLALLLGGCAGVAGSSEESKTAAAAQTARDPIAARHRQQAEALERDGQLRRAAEEWKIALTITPGDTRARESLRALQARIDQQVAERIEEGRKAVARRVQVEARRKFLAALALDPANRAAFDALQNDTREVEFISHTVRAGDTLSSLAQRYYGDRSRSEVIWETNQLPPNPRLVAGVVLKIPEIPGVPFVNPENRPHPPVEPPVRHEPPPTTPEAPAKEAPPQETTEINPLLVTAKEALDRGEFQVALVDVDKLLSGNAQNVDGVDLKKQILYGLGKSQLGRGRYDESIQTLGQLAKLAPNYQDSPTMLRRAKEQSAQAHYRQGLELYQKEKLEEAIAQWRTVLELDPQHANAKRNLERAEAQLRLLQQRQQPKKQ